MSFALDIIVVNYKNPSTILFTSSVELLNELFYLVILILKLNLKNYRPFWIEDEDIIIFYKVLTAYYLSSQISFFVLEVRGNFKEELTLRYTEGQYSVYTLKRKLDKSFYNYRIQCNHSTANRQSNKTLGFR